MATLPDVLAILDSLVELYKADVTAYYFNAAKDKKTNGRSVPRFSFTSLARKIFDPVPPSELPSLYIELFDRCDGYALSKGITQVGNLAFPQSCISLRDLILSVIIPYQLPQSFKKTVVEKGNSKKKVKNVQVPPRCSFSMGQAQAMFQRFLTIQLPPDTKLWKQMRFILMRSFKPEEAEKFAGITKEMVKKGQISFAALSEVMRDSCINKFLSPEVILHALYIGPLKAQTVEAFACNRPSDFRKSCRDVLAIAEKARKDSLTHSNLRPSNIQPEYALSWSYMDFAKHTNQLLGELKGVKTSHPDISPSWAYSAVKKFGKRTYVDKTYSHECYYDLLWTIMVQRPNMKKFIVETLEKDFTDKEAAKFWRKMNPAQMSRHKIAQGAVKEISLLENTEEFLNFPSTVRDITMVDTAAQLHELKDRLIVEILEGRKCVVGLDAEWSAFSGYSKATILQIAVSDHIYIVDIESASLSHNLLREFFTLMFLRKEILKIGFQFGEDLLQLRNAVANCKALYHPERVVCVGRLVADLLDLTEKRPNAEEILLEICPNFLTNDKMNDTVESQEPEEDKENDIEEEKITEDAAVSNSAESLQAESRATKVLNKGLSYLCEQVLGRPLDKMEQCSVWDRRPLRPLQMRYAAMDAYCLLMIFDVCDKWARRLNTTVDDLLATQTSPKSSLPLYSDDG